MDEKKINQRNSFLVSFRGVIYLVLVMIGIFALTSLVRMTGISSEIQEAGEQETRKEQEAFQVKKKNGTLKLVENEEGNAEISSLPLGMYLCVLGYENGILELEMDNQSGYRMEYKEIFTIEKKDSVSGEWAVLGTIYDAALTDPESFQMETVKGVLILDLTKARMKCDLNVLGELEEGQYRVIMDDITAEFALEEGEE